MLIIYISEIPLHCSVKGMKKSEGARLGLVMAKNLLGLCVLGTVVLLTCKTRVYLDNMIERLN